MRGLNAVIIIFSLAFVAAASSRGNELQSRIDAAAPGATIEVDAGVYHGTILVKGSPDGAHEDLVGALGRALSGVEHEGTIALVEVGFRGKPRLAIQHHIAQGRDIAERVRQVLGDRMLETYCVFREPTRELGSW